MKSKISFFLPSFNIGGVERVFINYANALSDKGYNVDFVVCKAEGVLLDLVSSSVKVVSLGNISFAIPFLSLGSISRSVSRIQLFQVETFRI